ncbi:MAG: FtsX-like permease family protein [Acidimicrobiaceae bacterium]|nr:FtsX-like permease family protein [Acidimicrobiaceae bacterium]
MRFSETLRAAVDAIISHRSRSILTVLGILIGIAAVIVTVGIGEGTQSSVTSAISALGSNVLTVTSGSSTTGGVRGGAGSSTSLTMSDALALGSNANAPQVVAVAPVVQTQASMQAGSSTWTAPVIGTTPPYLGIRGRQLSAGRFITPSDVTSRAAVAVLGSQVASELFAGQDPVGQTVDIGTTPFQVVGTLKSAGSSSTNQDDQVIVPITTAQQVLIGNISSISQILLKASSSSTIGPAYQEANDLLLQLHGITVPSQADFTITPDSQLLATTAAADAALTILLVAIAAISLLVGGIGVMNIMLVSVTERIREIGLRKALGATPGVILRQFLAEALLLGLAGGIIGVGLGVGLAILLPHLISQPVAISSPAILGSVFIAAGIGLVFGVYPASRAARLTPIDALRSD